MKADSVGLYVHIPFCKRKCNYCDFCSFPLRLEEEKKAYLAALSNEIESYRGKSISVDTVFFGGGTPSLLSGDELSFILESLRSVYKIEDDAEITLEANPGTVNEQTLKAYRSSGVNRLSFGLQSIHENELKLLGRIHSFEDFKLSYEGARLAGFTNINVDIMYGIPEQTASSFIKTINEIVALSPEHISVYGLIIEEGTPLFENRDKLVFPPEDEECDMYYAAADLLSKKGYCHYEISNYSIPDFECKHNLKYWRDLEYIGLGLDAHSYFRGERFNNTAEMQKYLIGNYLDNRSEVLQADREFEFAMLALRLKEGISNKIYRELFGKDFILPRIEKLKQFSLHGLLIFDEERVALTEKGFYVSNSILTELL